MTHGRHRMALRLKSSSTLVDIDVPETGKITFCGDVHGQSMASRPFKLKRDVHEEVLRSLEYLLLKWSAI